jgi:hypothetical protein
VIANEELKTMWKDVVVVYFTTLSHRESFQRRKINEIRAAHILAEIRTSDLPHKKQD